MQQKLEIEKYVRIYRMARIRKKNLINKINEYISLEIIPADWREKAPRFYLMTINDEPIGCVSYKRGDSVIGNLYVEPEKRRQGYGTMLINHCIRVGRMIDRVRMFHAYIRKDNTASINLFEKLGFVRIGKINHRSYKYRYEIRDDNDGEEP